VIERHQQEVMQTVRGELAEAFALPVEKAMRKLVAVAVKAHRVDPRLHRALVEQVPRVGRLENIRALDREAYALIRAYLEAHRDELRVADLELASFVCVATVEALTHAAVLNRPDVLGDQAAGVFTDEVTRLVVGYLRGP